MIKPLIIASSIALLSSSVYAGSANQGQAQGQKQKQSLQNTSLQLQGQYTNTGATSDVKKSGNSTNDLNDNVEIGINDGDFSITENWDMPVNSPTLAALVASNKCFGSATLGVTGQFIGLGGGTTVESKRCWIHEFTKLTLAVTKNQDAALAVMCEDKVVREAFSKTNAVSCPGERVTATFAVNASTNQRINSGDCEYPTPQCKTRRGK